MKMKFKKFIGILLLGIIILIQFNAIAYASMDPEQIKSLFDMYENNLGDIKILNTNEIYFDAKTNLGDTKINNNYNKSEITLKIQNDCGDIEINN